MANGKCPPDQIINMLRVIERAIAQGDTVTGS